MDEAPEAYNKKKAPLQTKSYDFAVRIVNMFKYLCKDYKSYSLANQVLRSGTSVGALIREAEFAQSVPDFINKLSISLKEANETFYWLSLLHDTGFIEEDAYSSMSSDCKELIAILVTSIKTAKKRKTGN